MQPLLQYKSNKYYIPWEYVLVVLGTQHEMHMCHIVICGLYGSTIFFHIIYKRHNLKKKLQNIKRVFWFSLEFCPKRFSF